MDLPASSLDDIMKLFLLGLESLDEFVGLILPIAFSWPSEYYYHLDIMIMVTIENMRSKSC